MLFRSAVRAHSNVRALEIGVALASTEIVGTGKYLNSVTAPNTDIGYTYLAAVPAIGTLYLVGTYATGTSTDFAPATTTYSEW